LLLPASTNVLSLSESRSQSSRLKGFPANPRKIGDGSIISDISDKISEIIAMPDRDFPVFGRVLHRFPSEKIPEIISHLTNNGSLPKLP
jgi:hypothetical protein